VQTLGMVGGEEDGRVEREAGERGGERQAARNIKQLVSIESVMRQVRED
jgi:hypothetical protein